MFNEGLTEYQDFCRELPILRRVCFDGSPSSGGSGSSSSGGNSGSVYTGSPNDYAAYAAYEAGQGGSSESSGNSGSSGSIGVPSGGSPEVGVSGSLSGSYGGDPFYGSGLEAQPEVAASGSAFGSGGPLQGSSGLYGVQPIGSYPFGGLPGGWLSPEEVSTYEATEVARDTGLGERGSDYFPVDGSLRSGHSGPRLPQELEGPSSNLGTSGPNPNFVPPNFQAQSPFSSFSEGLGNWWSGLSEKGGSLYVPSGGSATPGFNSKGEPTGGPSSWLRAAQTLPGIGGVGSPGIPGFGASLFSGSIHGAPNLTIPLKTLTTSLGIGSGAIATVGATGYFLDQVNSGKMPTNPFLTWVDSILPNLGGGPVPGANKIPGSKQIPGLVAPSGVSSGVPGNYSTMSASIPSGVTSLSTLSDRDPNQPTGLSTPIPGSTATRVVTLGSSSVKETLTYNQDGSITGKASGRSTITYKPEASGSYQAAILAFRPTTGVNSGTLGPLQKLVTVAGESSRTSENSSGSVSPSVKAPPINSFKPDSTNNYGGMARLKPRSLIEASTIEKIVQVPGTVAGTTLNKVVREPINSWDILVPKFGESAILTRELGFRQSEDGHWFAPTTREQFYDPRWQFENGFLMNIDGKLYPNPDMVNSTRGVDFYNAGLLQAWGGTGPLSVLPMSEATQGIRQNAFFEYNNFLNSEAGQRAILGDKYKGVGTLVNGKALSVPESQSLNRSLVNDIVGRAEIATAGYNWENRKAQIPGTNLTLAQVNPAAVFIGGDRSRGWGPNNPAFGLYSNIDPFTRTRQPSTSGLAIVSAGMSSTPGTFDYGANMHYHTQGELDKIQASGGSRDFSNIPITYPTAVPAYYPMGGRVDTSGGRLPFIDRDGNSVYPTSVRGVYTSNSSGIPDSGGLHNAVAPRSKCAACNLGQTPFANPNFTQILGEKPYPTNYLIGVDPSGLPPVPKLPTSPPGPTGKLDTGGSLVLNSLPEGSRRILQTAWNTPSGIVSPKGKGSGVKASKESSSDSSLLASYGGQSGIYSQV